MPENPPTCDEWDVLARVGHEIRTPMHGILALAEFLLDSGLTSEQRRSVELMQISAQSLLTLTNDLLDYGKLTSDRLELERIPFDLIGLVDSTVRLLAVRAFERGIEMSFDVAADVPRTVRGDPSRLRQILTNLIANAVKFTHEGGVFVSVTLEEERTESALIRFAVRDTGVGIPADKLDAIFDEYAQVDVSTSRKYGGTGLGLAIARRLARLMGGDVEVSSTVGHGSEFAFTAWLAPEPDVVASLGAAPSLTGIRVLVLDDNAGSRTFVRSELEAVGMIVDEADSVEQAVETLQQAATSGNPVSVMILDAWISRRDGFEVAKALRGDATLGNPSIMILTAAGRRGDGQRCREVGVQAYLTKPVTGEELIGALASMLRAPVASVPTDALVTRHFMEETRRRLTILLAEDNEVNQRIATAILTKRGHVVETVGTGRDAVAAVSRRAYDLVLMDIEMPEMDGITATAAIRRDPAVAELPIIAMTAHATGGEQERFRAAGMTDYLTKPFKPQDLVRLVEGIAATPSAARTSVEIRHPPAPVAIEEFRRSLREAGIEETTGAILAVFREDAPGRMADLEAASATGDSSEIRMAAHAFKSAAATIRALNLAELLQQAESAAEAGDQAHATELIPQIREEYGAVMEFLQTVA